MGIELTKEQKEYLEKQAKAYIKHENAMLKFLGIK